MYLESCQAWVGLLIVIKNGVLGKLKFTLFKPILLYYIIY